MDAAQPRPRKRDRTAPAAARQLRILCWLCGVFLIGGSMLIWTSVEFGANQQFHTLRTRFLAAGILAVFSGVAPLATFAYSRRLACGIGAGALALMLLAIAALFLALALAFDGNGLPPGVSFVTLPGMVLVVLLKPLIRGAMGEV
jgi:hypothetical protein